MCVVKLEPKPDFQWWILCIKDWHICSNTVDLPVVGYLNINLVGYLNICSNFSGASFFVIMLHASLYSLESEAEPFAEITMEEVWRYHNTVGRHIDCHNWPIVCDQGHIAVVRSESAKPVKIIDHCCDSVCWEMK